MLYLNPPFYVINGVSLFPDHADPLQYYYLPVAPKLTQIQDTATGQSLPQIQVIKYRGTAGTGGFLNFDVNIGVEQDALDEIRDELKRLARLPETPRLSPVPLVDGTVKMMLFGVQTAPSPSPAPIDPNALKFVLKIDQAAKPALYGNNQAAFSVSLDASGVTVLEKALQGELSPIGIVYSLDYLALRPAYSVRLEVDWERVQKRLDEQFGVDAIFVSTQIDKAVDELIDKRVIVLEVDTFVPEGEDTSGIIGRRDQAVNEVREMITNAFFEPSLNPEVEQPDGWDRAAFLADRVSRMAVSGGASSLGTFSYKKTDYSRIDRKRLNVNFKERTTVKCSIYPQGHLSGLFRVLQQQGVELSRFVTAVDLGDPWFARRRINVISRANFEEDSIVSLNVSLQYGNDVLNVILDSNTTTAGLSWLSLLENGVMQQAVKTRYKATFKGVDGTERPIALASLEQSTDLENLEINPRELYSIVQIPIVPSGFPWDRYPQVEVQTRYHDQVNDVHIDDVFLLNKDRSEAVWKLFTQRSGAIEFEYKIIYRAADNRDVEKPWTRSREEQILLRDPFPSDQRRTVDIVANVSWTEVDQVFVDLVYSDPQSYADAPDGVYKEASVSFSQTDATTKSFSVELRNPKWRRVGYSVTVIFKDGRMMQIPNSFTLDRRIFIRSDMKGHKVILIQLEAIDFAKKQIKSISVETRYEDAIAGSYADIANFAAANGQAAFEFDYAESDQARYQYQITYQYLNGLSRTTDWLTTDDEELIIPVT
jgi:uncharacterized protein YaaQ